MSYCFELGSDLTDDVRRIALQQIKKAAKQLSSIDDQPSAVLEARKAFKRLRALLRLIRPALDTEVYQTEVTRFRDMGRQLSMTRDAQILDETLSKLQANPLARVSPDFNHRVRAALAELTKEPLTLEPSAVAEVRNDLEQARRAYRHFDLAGTDGKLIFKGFEQSYRKARKAFQVAYADKTDEAFHNWRKPLQVHWRQTRLLQNVWPQSYAARCAEARTLSHVLGDDQDLSVLLSFAERAADLEKLKKQDYQLLQHIILEQQSRLRRLAQPMGRLLFNEPAKAHAARSFEMWKAATAMGRLEQSPARSL
jgi:CHAD domain-containing protein